MLHTACCKVGGTGLELTKAISFIDDLSMSSDLSGYDPFQPGPSMGPGSLFHRLSDEDQHRADQCPVYFKNDTKMTRKPLDSR